jgi:hypothetical protein
LLVGGAGAHAAAGELHGHERHVERRIGAGHLDLDAIGIDVQLFGHRHGQAGVYALAHLGLADDDGDGVIRRDAHEGIGLQGTTVGGRGVEAFLGQANAEIQAAADHGTGNQEVAA